MSLLSEPDRDAVRLRLAVVQHPVTILFFTQTFGAPDTVRAARQIADEVASLNEQITVDEVNFVLERERAAKYGIEDVPAMALLRNGKDTRIRFLGAPSGYEFLSLVDAAILAGTGDSGLSPESRKAIAERVAAPMELRVFVTPTCPHCPRAVTLAHRMAVESEHITAVCIEATEFMDLSRRYRVTGVPKTVVDDRVEILGALPEAEFVRQILGGDVVADGGAAPA
jgi:glutaredoxin-like protein